MNVLFDLNVLIDVGTRWQRFPDSLHCFESMSASDHVGMLPACGYMTLYYVMAQSIGSSRSLQVLQHFHERLRVVAFDSRTMGLAHRLDFSDFEDACVAASAVVGDCDAIITRNVGDFSKSPIRAVSPSEWLATDTK